MNNRSIEEILEILNKNYPNVDQKMVRMAYDFAAEGHKGGKRFSGRPQIDHVLNVAWRLSAWCLPENIVIAGLLHDIPEHTKYSLLDIKKRFGSDIAHMVEGEEILDSLKYRGQKRSAEGLRRMFLALSRDLRLVFIKFAERIDNMATLEDLLEEKQKRMALETLEIYAPIADRLGMAATRRELEDMAFKYLYPEKYNYVKKILEKKQKSRRVHFDEIRNILKQELAKDNIIPLEIYGRKKNLYAIYRKSLKYGGNIDHVYDIFAGRIILPKIEDCYRVLGILHKLWKPMRGRIKDYIAQPKPNGYQSLHTTVFCGRGEVVEFQLRTKEMNDEAEYGVAAHWFYREKGSCKKIDKHISWIKELVKVQKQMMKGGKNFLKLLDTLKFDFFHNRIFVFTPGGDVIELPESSTPVDFAYAIHSELGRSCVGAFVNQEKAPLDFKLFSGDFVKIERDLSLDKKPDQEWLKFVKTARAKNKIKEQLEK